MNNTPNLWPKVLHEFMEKLLPGAVTANGLTWPVEVTVRNGNTVLWSGQIPETLSVRMNFPGNLTANMFPLEFEIVGANGNKTTLVMKSVTI